MVRGWIRLSKDDVVHEGYVVDEYYDFDYHDILFYCVKCQQYHIYRTEYDIWNGLYTGIEKKILIKNIGGSHE